MIDDILLFLKVVDAGSILAAEKKLSIPHSTAARRIDGLEAKVGKTLLNRSPQGVSLTEDGRFFYDCFKSYERKLNDLFEENEISIEGKLNVVLPFTFANNLLIPEISNLLLKYPDLELNIVHNFNKFNMKKELYDLAITDYEPLQQSQKIKKIGRTKLLLLCTPEYAINYGLLNKVEDAYKHFIVCRSDLEGLESNTIKLFSEDDAKMVELEVKRKITLSSFVEAKSFIMGHQGIAELPEYLVQEELASNQLIRLFPEFHAGYIDYYLLRNINENDPKFKAFMTYINKIFDNLSVSTSERSFVDKVYG
ncbi:LysR family transcriptional regulator [Aquella oligotrophica]|uniref:HTH lysR-type domain-containing protein n=1 Tax=Aquella oligotrophica TaxID=2067065 RepID=A0A2I7N344_9NEIS|nr:LysR family transcriptional regulator [Aquella oligotrophica]AUR50860.1 hypothetical protein CUN60_00605 [Aquella oligotrophica]